ncbi:hypothetical protein ACVW06_003646 [Pantoea ananatis]|uniref:hypothetical protein n=2 Tax=Pantoea ananas TaxID=553 RepID=UPI000A4EA85B|nr:hypothetical protein [Pantoea ananatis]UYL00948.1 hypothetical protein NG830_17255 [Pantoea ananatis]
MKGVTAPYSVLKQKMNDFGSIRTWWRIEKPALIANNKITEVVRLKKNGTPSKFGHIRKCKGRYK